MRLLVVDDDRDYADSLQAFFELLDEWDTDVAYGAAESIVRASRDKPDAVIMDLNMPPETGFAAAAALKAHVQPPTIFAMSGNPDLVDRAREDRHFSRVVLKPVDPAVIVRWLAELSSKRL
jgi:two-component system, OmpR family, response regulator